MLWHYLNSKNSIRNSVFKRLSRRLCHNKPKYPLCENMLNNWFQEQWINKNCVTGTDLKAQMIIFMTENHLNVDFYASNGWLMNFLKRNNLTRRRISYSGRPFPSNTKSVVSSYLEKVNKTIEENNFTLNQIVISFISKKVWLLLFIKYIDIKYKLAKILNS